MPPEDRPFLYVTGSLCRMFALSDFFFLFSAIEYSRQRLLCSLDERHESLFFMLLASGLLYIQCFNPCRRDETIC